MLKYNVAEKFHLYGFHRDKGPYPGEMLRDQLKKILEDTQPDKVEIEFGHMKALYGSFVDGAFGFFIDKYKEDFFKKFVFQSEGKPEYLSVISAIYKRHQELNFNG